MRVRLTIEYDIDEVGKTIDDEQKDWALGSVDARDLFSLALSDPTIRVTFEEVGG